MRLARTAITWTAMGLGARRSEYVDGDGMTWTGMRLADGDGIGGRGWVYQDATGFAGPATAAAFSALRAAAHPGQVGGP